MTNLFFLFNYQKKEDDLFFKKKGELKKKKEPFFINTFFLLEDKDIVFLEVEKEVDKMFLAKTYRLEYQKICEEIGKEKKNLIIFTKKQWFFLLNRNKKLEISNQGSALILGKDKQSIQEALNIFFNC